MRLHLTGPRAPWRPRAYGVTPNMLTTAFLLMTLVPADVPAQQKPTTGYAPVNGVKMYYEVHGSGEPVLLLHGAFMTITNNWTRSIAELSKTRKVIAVEMQGHGRTADGSGLSYLPHSQSHIL